MMLTASLLLSLGSASPEPGAAPEPSAIESEQQVTRASGSGSGSEPGPETPALEEPEEPEPEAPVSEEPPPEAPVGEESGLEPEPEFASEWEPEPDSEPEPVPDPVYDPLVEQPQTPEGRSTRGQRRYGKRGPPVYGPILAGAGLGASSRSVSLGGSLTGFVIPWVGIGASLDNTLYFGGSPTFYEFTLVPHLFLIALPYSRFTPYVRGGVGLQAFTSGLGVYAQWQGGGGFIWRLGAQQRLALRAGVEVVGSIPDARFAQSFRCGLTNDPCSLALRPSLGVGYRFGRS